MKERDLVKKIREYIASIGGISFKHHATAFSEIGTPDIIAALPCSCCRRALFIGIEVKLPGKNPTPAQSAWCKRWRDAGAIVFVARGVEDVKKALVENCFDKF